MTNTLKIFAALILAAVSLVAETTVTYSVNNTTSATYTNASHALGSKWISVSVYNANGDLQPTSAYTWAINPSTYQVDLAWPTNFTGTVKLRGPMPSSDTSSKFSYYTDTAAGQFRICSGAGSDSQRVTYQSKVYTCSAEVTYSRETTGSRSVYVYIAGNQLVFCESGSNAVGSLSGSDAQHRKLVGGCAGGFPGGVIQLYSFAILSNGTLSSLADYRPW